MNGVSVTLKKIGWLAHERHMDIRLVTALGTHESVSEAPPETVRLPYVYDLALPYYEDLHLRIPSILKALKSLNELEPDEIFISTPGPWDYWADGLAASRSPLQSACTTRISRPRSKRSLATNRFRSYARST